MCGTASRSASNDSEQLVLQLHMKIVGQGTAEFGLDFRIRLARRAAEETIEDLFCVIG